ncbi:hypothetical protein [Ramlibacter sp. AN1133]|uniref:hypothetical protein n=1 Tax=Ramlibacter sp. AN1133 TaxID=3133429 RepID=UPI0030C4F41C
MNQVWEEVVFALRQVPQLALAPFVGALREMRRVSDEVGRANRARHERPEQPSQPSERR